MPSYRIPSDARVQESIARVLRTRPIVESQRKLKQLIEKDLKGDERYRVGEPRLRLLAIESGLELPGALPRGDAVTARLGGDNPFFLSLPFFRAL